MDTNAEKDNQFKDLTVSDDSLKDHLTVHNTENENNSKKGDPLGREKDTSLKNEPQKEEPLDYLKKDASESNLEASTSNGFEKPLKRSEETLEEEDSSVEGAAKIERSKPRVKAPLDSEDAEETGLYFLPEFKNGFFPNAYNNFTKDLFADSHNVFEPMAFQRAEFEQQQQQLKHQLADYQRLNHSQLVGSMQKLQEECQKKNYYPFPLRDDSRSKNDFYRALLEETSNRARKPNQPSANCNIRMQSKAKSSTQKNFNQKPQPFRPRHPPPALSKAQQQPRVSNPLQKKEPSPTEISSPELLAPSNTAFLLENNERLREENERLRETLSESLNEQEKLKQNTAVYKIQADLYREDFEKERADRENAMGRLVEAENKAKKAEEMLNSCLFVNSLPGNKDTDLDIPI